MEIRKWGDAKCGPQRGGREPGSLQGSWDRYCLSGEQRASAGPVSRVTPLSPTPSSASPWYVARRHAVLKRNVTRRSPGIVCGRASRATRAAIPEAPPVRARNGTCTWIAVIYGTGYIQIQGCTLVPKEVSGKWGWWQEGPSFSALLPSRGGVPCHLPFKTAHRGLAVRGSQTFLLKTLVSLRLPLRTSSRNQWRI